MKPSFKIDESCCRQILYETSSTGTSIALIVLTKYSPTFSMSGSQRAIRSGLGFPNNNFRPCVAKKVAARAKAKPIQLAFHSHSLRRQIRLLEMFLESVGPGTRIRHVAATMTAGTTRPTIASAKLLTVPGSVSGKEMVRSRRSKALWLGVMMLKMAPPTAMRLQ